MPFVRGGLSFSGLWSVPLVGEVLLGEFLEGEMAFMPRAVVGVAGTQSELEVLSSLEMPSRRTGALLRYSFLGDFNCLRGE